MKKVKEKIRKKRMQKYLLKGMEAVDDGNVYQIMIYYGKALELMNVSEIEDFRSGMDIAKSFVQDDEDYCTFIDVLKVILTE